MTRIFLRFLLDLDITGVQLPDYPVSLKNHDFKFFYVRYDEGFPTISEFLRRNSSIMSDMTIVFLRFQKKQKSRSQKVYKIKVNFQ